MHLDEIQSPDDLRALSRKLLCKMIADKPRGAGYKIAFARIHSVELRGHIRPRNFLILKRASF